MSTQGADLDEVRADLNERFLGQPITSTLEVEIRTWLLARHGLFLKVYEVVYPPDTEGPMLRVEVE